MTPAGLQRKLERVDVEQVTFDVNMLERPTLADMQEQQMMSGLASDGAVIGRYRNTAYAQKKNKMNPKAGLGNVDLRLTGSFQSDIFVQPEEDRIVFGSGDPKTNELTAKYGDRIFGLTMENLSEYRGIFYKRFQAFITQITGLRFQ